MSAQDSAYLRDLQVRRGPRPGMIRLMASHIDHQISGAVHSLRNHLNGRVAGLDGAAELGVSRPHSVRAETGW